MARRNYQINLPDGRKLGYDEHGRPDGKPIFYLHGTPSARVEADLFVDEALLSAFNIRLIAVDRPGMGISEYQPNRRFSDFPKDLAALADHLNIERFGILAYSGGGPYGAACALYLPKRITRVGIVSGTAPFDLPGNADGIAAPSRRFMDLSYQKPRLSRWLIRMMAAMCRLAPQKVIANAVAALPQPDREVLARPEFQKGFLTIVLEAARKGPRGPQHDTRLMVTPWDFQPQEIRIAVDLWHGELDQNAPVAMGRYMAAAIPNSRARFYPEDGHLSLFKKYFFDIVQELVGEVGEVSKGKVL